MTDEIWIIDISGYGAFVFRGDEDDCEHMRAEKAQWEGGRGQKWRAEDGLADPNRANKTARTLLGAVRYPKSVADQSNYGPSPKKAEAA